MLKFQQTLFGTKIQTFDLANYAFFATEHNMVANISYDNVNEFSASLAMNALPKEFLSLNFQFRLKSGQGDCLILANVLNAGNGELIINCVNGKKVYSRKFANYSHRMSELHANIIQHSNNYTLACQQGNNVDIKTLARELLLEFSQLAAKVLEPGTNDNDAIANSFIAGISTIISTEAEKIKNSGNNNSNNNSNNNYRK